MIRDPSLTAMTEKMVLKYTDYPDLATYLRGYAITGRMLGNAGGAGAPRDVRGRPDDPRRGTSSAWRGPASLEVTVTPRGGHCGYMEALGGPSWIDRRIADELAVA